jgi:hypothetical protein
MITKPALVPRYAAAALLGVRPRDVSDMAEAGRLLWVFDVRGGTTIQCLRFLSEELTAPSPALRAAGIEAILDRILPFQVRQTISGPETAVLLCLAWPSIVFLRNHGEIASSRRGRSRPILLASLKDFLRRRWLGNFTAGARPPQNRAQMSQGRPISPPGRLNPQPRSVALAAVQRGNGTSLGMGSSSH